MSDLKKSDKELNKIIKLVNNSNISSIKHTIVKILNVINNPESSAKDLEGIIEKDPPLLVRLLKRANSAFYSYPKTITGIRESIVLIGFNAVKELALSQKVCELFNQGEYLEGYSRSEVWKHSVAVAVCAKLIYRREFARSGENIYSAGLLHDIGIIIEDQFLQNEFKYIQREFKANKKNLYEIENNDLGYNHTDIGKTLAENWKFPDELVAALGHHHNPNGIEDEFKTITATLYIADYACQKNRIGYCDSPYKNDILYKNYLIELNIKEKGIDIILEEVQKEIDKMEKTGWFQNGN